MTAISGKDFVKGLQRHSWILLRINGSHHILGKSGSTVRLTVPVHGNQSLKTGLMKSLLKAAELGEMDF